MKYLTLAVLVLCLALSFVQEAQINKLQSDLSVAKTDAQSAKGLALTSLHGVHTILYPDDVKPARAK